MEVAVAAGQDPLRRLQQLRRLAHRAGPGRGRASATSSAWSASSRIYNLLDPRRSSWRCCPAAQHYGLGVIPWSPLHGGLLGGVLRKEREGKRRLEGRAAETVAQHRDADRGVRGLRRRARARARRRGAGLAAAPARASPAPIVGPRTQEQLDAAVRALDVTLDDKALARLDEIFPGHKTAPEDYAW